MIWLALGSLAVVILGVYLFLRGAKQQEVRGAYEARKHAVASAPYIPSPVRPFSQRASKGITPRDPVINRDQVTRSERRH